MFSPTAQNKLALVLNETFDPYTLAGQFNAVAKALAGDAPRSDHHEALLKTYRAVLNTVAQKQYQCAQAAARKNATDSGAAHQVEGILEFLPAPRSFHRGRATPLVRITTAQGVITVHVVGVKNIDPRRAGIEKAFAKLHGQKVFARGFLWANEDGVNLTLADAKDLKRFSPAAKKTSILRKK